MDTHPPSPAPTDDEANRPAGPAHDLLKLPLPNLVSGIRAGRVRVMDLIHACLAQIDATESTLRAWQYLDRDGALQCAADCAAEAGRREFRGELHGIPVGIKDIIDVAGMPCECGSKLRAGRIADDDAKSSNV